MPGTSEDLIEVFQSINVFDLDNYNAAIVNRLNIFVKVKTEIVCPPKAKTPFPQGRVPHCIHRHLTYSAVLTIGTITPPAPASITLRILTIIVTL